MVNKGPSLDDIAVVDLESDHLYVSFKRSDDWGFACGAGSVGFSAGGG